MEIAQAGLPPSVRESDREQLLEFVSRDIIERELLMRPGEPALCVARNFALVVSWRYADMPDDLLAARDHTRRLSAATEQVRRLFDDLTQFDPISNDERVYRIGDAARALEYAAGSWAAPQKGTVGARGFPEFRCWVRLLAEAWKDITGRKASLTHPSPMTKTKDPGNFVAFVENEVKRSLVPLAGPLAPWVHDQRQRAPWWSAEETARASLIDDEVYGKSAKRRGRRRTD